MPKRKYKCRATRPEKPLEVEDGGGELDSETLHRLSRGYTPEQIRALTEFLGFDDFYDSLLWLATVERDAINPRGLELATSNVGGEDVYEAAQRAFAEGEQYVDPNEIGMMTSNPQGAPLPFAGPDDVESFPQLRNSLAAYSRTPRTPDLDALGDDSDTDLLNEGRISPFDLSPLDIDLALKRGCYNGVASRKVYKDALAAHIREQEELGELNPEYA